MKTFRHSAAFGKRIEYWIIGRMLKDGLDVYVPLVDDDAIDLLVKRTDGSIAQVQVKARSASVVLGDAALFSAITHEFRQDYWFNGCRKGVEYGYERFIKYEIQNFDRLKQRPVAASDYSIIVATTS